MVKNKVIKDLFGKDLLEAMSAMLNDFVKASFDVEMICKAMEKINESVRTGLYLMALENNYDDVAYKIKKANKILNEKRKEKFLLAYKNKETDKFLALLGKGDKISLMSDLGIDVSVEERTKFTKEQRDYYEIISNSIMLDQEDDARDGIDKFIKYKKEEA